MLPRRRRTQCPSFAMMALTVLLLAMTSHTVECSDESTTTTNLRRSLGGSETIHAPILDLTGRRGSNDKDGPPAGLGGDDSSRKGIMNRNGFNLLPDESSSESTPTPKPPPGKTPNNVMTDDNIQEAVDIWCSNPTLGQQYFGPISEWNTTAVTSFRGLFRKKTNFNDDCSQWDTQHVTSMAAMFEDAHAFDQDLSSWDTAQVISMSAMFAGATSFTGTKNGNSLQNWNVEKVARMDRMFQNAILFNGNLKGWNTSKVHHVANMFHNALSYTGGPAPGYNDLADWPTGHFVDLSGMFQHAVVFGGNITHWNLTSATEMDDMFANAIAFDRDLGLWNTANVITMARMFQNATHFKGRGLSKWNVENVRNFYGMFEQTQHFDADLSSWKPLRARNMEQMFFNASKFGQQLPQTISETSLPANAQQDFKLVCWQLGSSERAKTQNMFCGAGVRFDPCCATSTQMETSCCNRFCYNTTTTCLHPEYSQQHYAQYEASSGNMMHEEDMYPLTPAQEHDPLLAAEGHARDNFAAPKEDSSIGWEGIFIICVMFVLMMLCFWGLVKYL